MNPIQLNSPCVDDKLREIGARLAHGLHEAGLNGFADVVVTSVNHENREVQNTVVGSSLGVGSVDSVVHVPRIATKEASLLQTVGKDLEVLRADHALVEREVGKLSDAAEPTTSFTNAGGKGRLASTSRVTRAEEQLDRPFRVLVKELLGGSKVFFVVALVIPLAPFSPFSFRVDGLVDKGKERRRDEAFGKVRHAKETRCVDAVGVVSNHGSNSRRAPCLFNESKSEFKALDKIFSVRRLTVVTDPDGLLGANVVSELEEVLDNQFVTVVAVLLVDARVSVTTHIRSVATETKAGDGGHDVSPRNSTLRPSVDENHGSAVNRTASLVVGRVPLMSVSRWACERMFGDGVVFPWIGHGFSVVFPVKSYCGGLS